MESKYSNSFTFKIELHHYKDIVNLHYKLLNILLLICYNDSDYYCFCNATAAKKNNNNNLVIDLSAFCRIKIHF